MVLILANLVVARGFNGLAQAFASRPVHMAASFLFAFLAVPIGAAIAAAGRRQSARRDR
jgi:hypothetical protein